MLIFGLYKAGVDFINGFAPLRPTFAPCVQLLRSFLLAQISSAERERSTQGTKRFIKLTPVLKNKKKGKKKYLSHVHLDVPHIYKSFSH